MASELQQNEPSTLLHIQPITEENFYDVCELKITTDNPHFVDTPLFSMSEAWLHRPTIEPLAIYLGEKLIGFTSLCIESRNPQILNFFIINNYQRKGYGKVAAKQCIAYLQKHAQATRISTPVHIDNTDAQQFWHSLGFKASNTIEDNYCYWRLKLV